jgi:hypothetical protein
MYQSISNEMKKNVRGAVVAIMFYDACHSVHTPAIKALVDRRVENHKYLSGFTVVS